MTDRVDWDKLRIFHAVADAGSLTHAGDVLHLSQSAVSRQVRALEESLGTILFHRHARGLILTEQGEMLFDATRAMTRKLDTTAARIRDSEEHVVGELKVTTTTGFGTLWLVPRLAKLYERYPDIKIELLLEERVLDLPMREADIAIRMKEPSQADLIRRRLLNIRMRLYASPEYVAARGMPRSMEELAAHRLICQSPSTPQVAAGAALSHALLSGSVTRTLLVNSYFGVLQGVLNHIGIGILPDYMEHEAPNLIQVVPVTESSEVPVFLAYPEELRSSRRVAAFRDFVVEEIQAMRRNHNES